MAFSVELAFGRRNTLRAERRSSTVARVGATTPGDEPRHAADLSPLGEHVGSTRRWGGAGLVLTGLGAVLHTGVLVTRSAATGRVP